MNTIHVTASRAYDVQIGSGLLPSIGNFVASRKGVQRVCIVSDSNVWPLHGRTVEESLAHHGFSSVHFVFPAGETYKNADTFLNLLNFLAENHITRTDLIIALGGGVVGDLAGFAAATYLRGIPYIQVPTTLLAAVDSSVGGKTAIDLPAGKNLAGAFYQPVLVLCDTDCLNTLPEDIFRDGCAEVIKYAILYDSRLFSHLADFGIRFHREDVISRCVELKRDVVSQDEFDTGSRMLLNLGHTFGHGVEAMSNFEISHGKAVAIGMAIAARSSAKLGICKEAASEKILHLLDAFSLPTTCDFSAADLARFAMSDKKRTGGTVNLILPRDIGDCIIRPTPTEEILPFIKAGL